MDFLSFVLHTYVSSYFSTYFRMLSSLTKTKAFCLKTSSKIHTSELPEKLKTILISEVWSRPRESVIDRDAQLLMRQLAQPLETYQ